VRARNRRSRLPRWPVILYTRQQAHACIGGFTSLRLSFVRGQLAAGVHVPLAQEQHELRLGVLWIEPRHGSMWKARSHAAYHGYSHLSGIEITSRLNRFDQSWFRPCLRDSGGLG